MEHMLRVSMMVLVDDEALPEVTKPETTDITPAQPWLQKATVAAFNAIDDIPGVTALACALERVSPEEMMGAVHAARILREIVQVANGEAESLPKEKLN